MGLRAGPMIRTAVACIETAVRDGSILFLVSRWRWQPKVDTLNPAERSVRMSLIRSKDTKPELVVRKAVWAAGFRYRLHGKGLPGRPDLVFPGLRTIVFVHGCYWHAHTCQKDRIPGQNSRLWREKFAANKARDQRNIRRLRRAGWSVLTVWECSLATTKSRSAAISKLLLALERRRAAMG